MSVKFWIEHDRRNCRNKARVIPGKKCTGNCGGTFSVHCRDAKGTPVRDKEGGTWETRKEAQVRLNVLEDRNRNNALGIYKKMTLCDASVIFRREIKPALSNDKQRAACDSYWHQINEQLGDRYLHEIIYKHVVDYWWGFLKRGCKPATANRSIMWICDLYERFYIWNEMVPEIMPEKVALPQKNPVTVAKAAIGLRNRSELPYKRTRRLVLEEIARMKSWCMEHSEPGFWYTIKMAMLTSLRLSDLARLKPGVPAVGIQGKTQRTFNLPVIIERPIDIKSRRRLWDAMRIDLGWYDKKSPLHTTWHDLRHCGPSIMGDKGIPTRHIQELLGHATDAQSKTYTHISQHALVPAMDAVRTELDSI